MFYTTMLWGKTTKFSYFYQEIVLKTRKTGFTNQLHLECTLKKPSFPRDVSPFYPKICPLTSKIRVKWGSLWPFSYIFVFVGVGKESDSKLRNNIICVYYISFVCVDNFPVLNFNSIVPISGFINL